MEKVTSLKIKSFPLPTSSLIYSSTLRTVTRNKSKSRKTCQTKVSSISKSKRPNSNNHRNIFKNQSWKAESQKKINPTKKRTYSQSFQKNNSRYSTFCKKDDSITLKKYKNNKKQHYFSRQDYSQLNNSYSPIQRSQTFKRSIFQETGFSKPQKYQIDFCDSKQLSSAKNHFSLIHNSENRSKNSTSIIQVSFKNANSQYQQILNRTNLLLLQYKKKCEQLQKDKYFYKKKLQKTIKKVKNFQQKKKNIKDLVNK